MNDNNGLILAGIFLSDALLSSIAITLLLCTLSLLLQRSLSRSDNKLRTVAETLYGMMQNAVQEVVPIYYPQVTPLIATLWIFVLVANLTGLIPGLHSPTANLSVTAALAIIVFFAVHWFGIRHLGLKHYLQHYLSPSPILLPFHLISEITRTLALAIRLFGNMMSLEMAALLVLIVAGFLVPVPLLMLHIIEAIVQAYIFGVLALLYIGSALENNLALQKSDPSHPQQEKTFHD
jgi:F-type H+-transporting ATPase subunit a